MTVTEVKGFGRQKAIRKSIAAVNIPWISSPNQMEIVAPDEPPLTVAIEPSSKREDRKIGDGKVFVPISKMPSGFAQMKRR